MKRIETVYKLNLVSTIRKKESNPIWIEKFQFKDYLQKLFFKCVYKNINKTVEIVCVENDSRNML